MNIRQLAASAGPGSTRRTFLQLAAPGLALVAASCIPGSRSPRLDGTFLQIWKKDAAQSPDEWSKRMQALRRLHCRELILQWVAYGDAFALSPSLLNDLLDAADDAGLRVTFGLPYDPAYWTMLTADGETRAAFLDRARAQGQTFIEAWRRSDHPAFAGFYCPYEIDQYSWSRESDRHLLTEYLKRLTEAADARGPLKISTFHSMLSGKTSLSDVWRTILDEVTVRPMVQDGVGPFGLANYDRLAALFAMLRARKTTFDVIVELFTQTTDRDGKAVRMTAAPMDRIRAQIQKAEKCGAAQRIGFAVDPYLTDRHSENSGLRQAFENAL